jgi:tRNA threonylcarbamoyladenosine biosynthesis protein TsaE
MSCATKSFVLSTEEDTRHLAQQFSKLLGPGDCVLLSGDIGSGKSFFSRSLIQHRFGQLIDVPSPTFTIVQTYDHPQGDIWHCDLYRLSTVDEIVELGLQAAFETAICLVEWPDRLGPLEPENPIRVNLIAEVEHHIANVEGSQDFIAQLGID